MTSQADKIRAKLMQGAYTSEQLAKMLWVPVRSITTTIAVMRKEAKQGTPRPRIARRQGAASIWQWSALPDAGTPEMTRQFCDDLKDYAWAVHCNDTARTQELFEKMAARYLA